MNLKTLKDQELLEQTKKLVRNERELLTQILHHLKEVERRRLYSELGYSSLFQYALKELLYSEGQAHRRIQAMRLIKEIPEVEKKVASGELSLSNVSQAQSYFRSRAKDEKKKEITLEEKREVLQTLENKSTREGEIELLKKQPQRALPVERQRPLTPSHTEVRFVMTSELEEQLQRVRALLGSKGANMSLAELISQMANLSEESLTVKRFGKKAVQKSRTFVPEKQRVEGETSKNSASHLPVESAPPQSKDLSAGERPRTFVPEKPRVKVGRGQVHSQRYIPRRVRYQVWVRDKGRCVRCGSSSHLQFEHIQPVALGGSSHIDNLSLHCFLCGIPHKKHYVDYRIMWTGSIRLS